VLTPRLIGMAGHRMRWSAQPAAGRV